MKIGILTFHRAHNYGAMLQCYSLAQTLKNLGHDIEVIDYLPAKFEAEYSLYPSRHLNLKHNIGKILKLIPIFYFAFKRNKSFSSFFKNFTLSKRYDSNSNSIVGYDVIVFGSDQIWNPLLTDGEDIIYSGKFKKSNTRFVSYAASSNPTIFNNKFESYFRGIISRFDAISVREDSLCTYLNSLKENAATTVLDPVFLTNVDGWKRLAKYPIDKKYLLIYTVPQTEIIYKLAKDISERLGLKIIELRPNARSGGVPDALRFSTPEEFIGFFANASYILTTSFHGTAFSLIFNKPFLTISLNSGINDRASSLLKSIGLENRIVNTDHITNEDLFFDYSVPNAKLNELKSKSINFLINSI